MYFISSLERERSTSGTAIYKASQWGWESKCPQCAEGPQNEVFQGPHSPALSIFVSLDCPTQWSWWHLVSPSCSTKQLHFRGHWKGQEQFCLCVRICVGVACLAITSAGDANFVLLRAALTNSLTWSGSGVEQDKCTVSQLTVTSWPTGLSQETLDFYDCALGERSGQCRQATLGTMGRRNLLDITCSAAVW